MTSFFANLKIGYFEDYLKLIKKTIESDSKKIEDRFQELKASDAKVISTDEGYWDPFDDVSDDAYQLSEMEQLMYRSYVIGVFIFIETQISDVCRILKRIKGTFFAYTDLKGNGVDRAIKYLQTISGDTLLADPLIKEEFEVAKIIRNSLVHNDAVIEHNDKKKIENYSKKHPKQISLSQYQEIEITHQYAESILLLSKKIKSILAKYDNLGEIW